MKRIILLSLAAAGMCMATTAAHAGGFAVGITIGRPCPPIFVPAVPILVTPHVVLGGCERPVVVRDFDRDIRFRTEERHDRFDHRLAERRENGFRRDRF